MLLETPKPRLLALEFPLGSDITTSLRKARADGFTVIVLPLAHSGNVRQPGSKNWGPPDSVLSAKDWTSVVPKTSRWLKLDDEDQPNRENAAAVLAEELLFIHHLGCESVIVELHQRYNINLMRHLLSHLTRLGKLPVKEEIVLQIPTSPKDTMNGQGDGVKEDEDGDTWHWWNDARLQCDSIRNLKVALELTKVLPGEKKLDRWLGEPVHMLIIPISLFTVAEDHKLLALPAAHQEFVNKMARRNTPILISGDCYAGFKSSFRSLTELYAKSIIPAHLECFPENGERLLTPLQPLADSLQSMAYTVFERDPIKYVAYGRAIKKALLDRVPEFEAETNTQVIVVVGAGRGPLVAEALNAASEANRKVRVYAVEKNPNAVIALNFRHREESWEDLVKVVFADVREWGAPEKCDILVSDLHGSFGDNELSPECLDGAQVHLKDDGISIPESYRSYVCPTMSMELYNEVRKIKSTFIKSPFEHVYVADHVSAYPIAPPQRLFEFVHPNRSDVINNDRFRNLKWTASEDSTLYGFSGYFDTTLYEDVGLSILPDATYTRGMTSWLPAWIPISRPMEVKKGDTISVSFWRCHDDGKVWYEWAVTKPAATGICNSSGKGSASHL